MRFQCSIFFVTIIVIFNIAAINGVLDLLENFDIQNVLHLHALYDMQTVDFLQFVAASPCSINMCLLNQAVDQNA